MGFSVGGKMGTWVTSVSCFFAQSSLCTFISGVEIIRQRHRCLGIISMTRKPS